MLDGYSSDIEALTADEFDNDLDDIMSTIKKHLTSDVKHVLPTYKKLPPIQSPPPYTGLTITKLGKMKPGNSPLEDSSLTQISSSDQKIIFDGKPILDSGDDSLTAEGDVKLIGYRSLDGQKKGYVPPGSELPPCRICGVKASGLHYGVNTCEACKAFFRRTLKKNSVDFQCTCTPADRKRNLEDPPRKTTCARCRYDRCIREGMSKDAIKIGRYTINRKRQNDREVNMLKEQGVVGRRISDSSPKSSSSADSPASSGLNVTSPEVMSPDTTTKSDGEESNVGMANKRLKTNEGKALATGLMESLTNSLFQSLLENQDSPVMNGDGELSAVEKLYMKPFEASKDLQYKTTIQVGKDPQATGPVTSTRPSLVQKGEKVVQPGTVPKQPVRMQQTNFAGPIQHISVTTSQQPSVVPGQNLFIKQEASPTVSTSGLDIQSEQKSLIETLFEANGTVPVGSETSAIENLLREPVRVEPASLSESQMATNVSSHVTEQITPHTTPSLYAGKQIANTEMTFDAISDILTDEDLLNEEPLDFPLNDKEIATKLKSMQDFQDANEDSLGSFADNFTLSDEVIASKLKSMQAHTLENENEALIASNLKSMEEQELDASALELQKRERANNESDLIATKLESMSKQYDEQCNEQCETQMLTGQELTEFEMYQSQAGAPVMSENPANADELQTICCTMIDTALASYVCPLKLSCEEIKERHKAYLEQYMLKTKVFGDLNNIPQEEYLQFYNQTGIDIDNRQEILIEYLKYAEQCISSLVTFSKVIPGFPALPLDDQVTLLKAARFSTLMIKDGLYGGQCQATAYQVATMPWNKEYHFEELKKVAPLKLFDMKAEVYEKVFEIGMTVEESIIVKAMAITYPKNEELIAPDKVEAIHNNMTECLLYQLQKRRTGKKPSLTSIFELLFYLREKSIMEQQFLMEMFETWPLTNNHQLLKEFVS